jgi:hypothetical protein
LFDHPKTFISFPLRVNKDSFISLSMAIKTVLFKVPEELGRLFKEKLARNGKTLQDWGNGAVEQFVNNAQRKPSKRAKVK